MSNAVMDITVAARRVEAAHGLEQPSRDAVTLAPMASVRLIASWRCATRPPFIFVDWEGLVPAGRLALERSGGQPWKLPELTTEQGRQVLQDYYRLTEDIGAQSGSDSVWWYTWSSSRDRHYSRILEQLELLARLRLYAGACESELTLFCHDPYVAAAVADTCADAGLRITRSWRSRVSWMLRRAAIWWAPWLTGAKVVRRAFLDRRALGTSVPQQVAPLHRRARVLLVTWLRNQELRQELPLSTYFGRLPAWLCERDVDVAIFGGLMEVACPLPEAQRGPCRVNGLPAWVRFGDLIVAYVRGLCGCIRVPTFL